MKFVQGKYLQAIESAKGKLKGMQLETAQGQQIVHLPKPLRAIAQQELVLGEDIRIWTAPKKQRLWAIAFIPLSPKASIPNMLAPITVQLCQKKNCCKRGGDALWQAFEAAAGQHKHLKITSVGCLGGCKHGPNIRLLPTNVKYYHVQPSDIDGLIDHQL
ncbi:MAG: (2Fe-2S) ferredoxin domain-containing protein [Phormidesmis sp. RL_2_1]|nr:(2Fe-2S) ferredoxin domain-containing protein [Phormidesmis sp. RL_2_1]